MARSKSTKLQPFQKLLTVMISGKAVTLEEIDKLLGNEIYMYRISTYMWHIKTIANGVVKSIKDGRKVVSYQLVNVEEVKQYMNRSGVTNSGFVAGQAVKKPSTRKVTNNKSSVGKLSDLNAKPTEEVSNVPEIVESVSEDLEVMEIVKV